MFGFTKRTVGYKTEVIETVIGVGLQNRNKFINYGDVAQENIYSGYAISRVFSEDQERLSFEFDAVYLHYLMSRFTKSGISTVQSRDALLAVFDSFDLPEAEQEKFYRRLEDYSSLSDPDIADRFIDNLDVEDFPDDFRKPSRKVLGGQFEALSKAVDRFVDDELRASRNRRR